MLQKTNLDYFAVALLFFCCLLVEYGVREITVLLAIAVIVCCYVFKLFFWLLVPNKDKAKR